MLKKEDNDMVEEADRIGNLIFKHFRIELTAEESISLKKWLLESKENRDLFKKLTDATSIKEKLKLYRQSEIPNGWEKIQKRLASNKQNVKGKKSRRSKKR